MTQPRTADGKFASKQVEVSKASSSFPSGTLVNSRGIGHTGLKRDFGFISEEFLPDLKGDRAVKVYREMRDNDPVVGSTFFAIEMFMRRVKWFVDAATDDDQGQEDAQFLRECMEDMSMTWPDFISEVMSMMEYGWAWFEILYKRRTDEENSDGVPASKFPDGKIGWRRFDIRSQDSLHKWEFDEDGGIAGMVQESEWGGVGKPIPIQKSLLFRTTTRKNNPEGRSVLRNAYRPWYFKKRIEEIEGVGVERDLAGLPFAEVPAEMMRDDASDDDKKTLASIVQLVKNVRRDEQEGVVWPQTWDENGNPQYQFKLMNSGGTRQFSTGEIITRYETRIAMTVLADFILLGQESHGSFALSTNKSGLFQSALAAWLDVIQDVLNNYAVPRLFRLNGIKGRPLPKFRHDEVQKPALADLATFVAALTGAGAQLFPDVELENHFRRLAQMPEREAKDEVKTREDDLRDEKLEAEIEGAKAAIKLAKNPPQQQPGGPVSGKQPGSRPGAPTKTTGKVKSKLPPTNRRRTAASAAAENVTKAVTTRVMNPKCKFCSEKATGGLLWAEGMAVIPHCNRHGKKARRIIEVKNNDEVVGTRKYPIEKRRVVRRKKVAA